MAEAKISAPWVTYVSKLKAIFEYDMDVTVTYDDETHEVELLVDGHDKAEALATLLRTERQFGNVTLTITVKPSNNGTTDVLVRKAFAGNDAVSAIVKADDDVPFAGGRTFVLFQPEVVQFFDDDLSDYNGLCTTLYQDIAREVFDTDAQVSFCTDLADD
jgi:hypothetical protein